MRLFLFITFIVVPIVEITIFLQVGSLIGVPATIALILLSAIFGTMLVRSQGMDVIRKIQTAAQHGEMPVAGMLQGFCVLVAGLLLVTPGFATDLFGFALLIPQVRELVARKLWRLIEPGIMTSTSWSDHGTNRTSKGDGVIIEGQAIEVENPDDLRSGKSKPNLPRR